MYKTSLSLIMMAWGSLLSAVILFLSARAAYPEPARTNVMPGRVTTLKGESAVGS